MHRIFNHLISVAIFYVTFEISFAVVAVASH